MNKREMKHLLSIAADLIKDFPDAAEMLARRFETMMQMEINREEEKTSEAKASQKLGRDPYDW